MTGPAIDIDGLLPHRRPMRLVDEILEADETRAVTCSVVQSNWPLVSGGAVDAMIIVELVAQTSGISNGLERTRTHGAGADRKGWLVGIKTATFTRHRIPVHTPIVVRAENRFSFEGFREIQGRADIDGETVAEVILQVVQADTGMPPGDLFP
jgi:predicted hotdog family 3-hydroxylacyl-ACP dehydratase